MTYARGARRPPESLGAVSLLVLLLVATVLSALRLVATTAAMRPGAESGASSSPAQTWLFAVLWIAAYVLEALSGWLVWRGRARPYGRASVVLLWILLGLQVLRLLNLLGNRLTAGQVPWSAFGTVVLLDVFLVVGVLVAWQVSRRAGVLLGLVLCWLLYVTALTGADALMKNGLPLT